MATRAAACALLLAAAEAASPRFNVSRVELRRRLGEQQRFASGALRTLQKLRRRLDDHEDDHDDDEPLSGACMEACGNEMQAYDADLVGAMAQMDGVSDERGAELTGDMMGCIYEKMCAHEGFFECLLEESACADDMVVRESNGGDDPNDLAKLSREMECFCNACPAVRDSVAGLTQAFMTALTQAFMSIVEESDQGDTEDEKMEMMCPLASGLKCAMEQASCAVAMSGDMMLLLRDDSGEVDMGAWEDGCSSAGMSIAAPTEPLFSCATLLAGLEDEDEDDDANNSSNNSSNKTSSASGLHIQLGAAAASGTLLLSVLA